METPDEEVILARKGDVPLREAAEGQMFKSLADHSQEFIGMCDLGLKPFYVNEAGRRLVGLGSLEEACAARVEEFFFPEDQRFISEEFLPKVLKEGAGEVEIRFRHFQTGAALWMIYNVFQVRDAQGQPCGYATASRDVTERKRAEWELANTGAELKEAQRLAHVGSWTWDARTGEGTASDEMLRIYGFDPATQKIPTFKDQSGVWYPPEEWERLSALAQHAVQTGEGYAVELQALRKGEPIWVFARAEAMREEGGKMVGLRGTVQDITDRKRAEAELARYREDLERMVAERTARLEELVGELEHLSYTITHDLKAPLRAMRGFAEMAEEVSGQSEATPFLEKIFTSAERMDRLISDAFDYSRLVRQELPLENVDTGALLRGMLESYPELQPSKAWIQVVGQLPVVQGNRAGLTQVFSNLLGNAVKFVKTGEKPEIRVWAEIGGESVGPGDAEKPGHGWVRI